MDGPVWGLIFSFFDNPPKTLRFVEFNTPSIIIYANETPDYCIHHFYSTFYLVV